MTVSTETARLKWPAVVGTVACALALAAAPAAAANPDRAFRTPVAHGAAAKRTAIPAAGLAGPLGRAFSYAGGRSGAWVMDAESGDMLFARGSGRRLQLASNTKLFTTSTALGMFGPDEHLETTVWAGDDFGDGVVSKGLFLVGRGDPTLSTRGLTKLAGRVAAAGVDRVTGPLLYDDSFLDRQDGISQRGINPDPLGTLSALTLNGGRGSRPEVSAAKDLAQALRKAGVSVPKKVRRGTLPEPVPAPVPVGTQNPIEVAAVASPPMSTLTRLTNVPSDNFLAEMLMKDVAGQFGDTGSTAAGVEAVKKFAAERGASFRGINGSGLSRADRASPESVGRLLASMLDDDTGAEKELRDAWIQSLAVAGRSGTLSDRMRGSAAAGNCAAKTGTLTGVSALSGYCFRPDGGATVFSILNNRVNIDRAHRTQDRMAALIARYRP